MMHKINTFEAMCRCRLTYKRNIQKGMHTAKTMKLAVCVLARDCAKRISPNISRLLRLRRYFADVRIYILENGSVDNTLAVLQKYEKANKCIKLYNDHLCEKAYAQLYRDAHPVLQPQTHSIIQKDNRFVSAERMKRMAMLRESVIYAVHEDNFEPDVLMQLDIDIYWFSLSGILHSFAYYNDWDAVCANGRKFSFCQHCFAYDFFYDTYALIPSDSVLIEPHATRTHNQEIFAPLSRGQLLYPVRSAFGGIGIHKYKTMLEASYYKSAEKYNFIMCEHVSFHKECAARGVHRVYINPSLIVHYNSFIKSLLYAIIARKISYRGPVWRLFIKIMHTILLPIILLSKSAFKFSVKFSQNATKQREHKIKNARL